MTDTELIDALEEFLTGGVLDTGFEIDGGIYLTISWPMDEVVLREQDSFRAALDRALAQYRRREALGKPKQ